MTDHDQQRNGDDRDERGTDRVRHKKSSCSTLKPRGHDITITCATSELFVSVSTPAARLSFCMLPDFSRLFFTLLAKLRTARQGLNE